MRCGLLLLICLIGFHGLASAGPLYNNLNSVSSGTEGVNVRNALMDSFSTGAMQTELKNVEFRLVGYPNPFGSFEVLLASDTGHGPGSILYTIARLSDLVFSTGGNLQLFNISVPGGYQLSANTRYWVGLYGATTTAWSFSTDRNALGVMREYWYDDNHGATPNFSIAGRGPFQMAVNTPEPDKLPLLGLALSILLGRGKRVGVTTY